MPAGVPVEAMERSPTGTIARAAVGRQGLSGPPHPAHFRAYRAGAVQQFGWELGEYSEKAPAKGL
jgi:hypothetical protein